MIRISLPVQPLTEDEIAQEAAHIQAALLDGQDAHISAGFLRRCSFSDCLRLLVMLPSTLTLNISFRPRKEMYLTTPVKDGA